MPETVIAAILGALVATIGSIVTVWLTNKGFNKRHSEELLHDESQRDKEREMSLRCEIYLPVIETIEKMRNLPFAVGNIEKKGVDIRKDIEKDLDKLSKVNLIGNNNTIKVIQELHLAFKKMIVDAFIKRAEIDSLNDEITILNEELNKTNDPDCIRVNEFKIDELSKEYFSKSFYFLKQSFDLFEIISKYCPPAIFSIRREMNLGLDENEYLYFFNKDIEENKKALNLVIDTFQSKLDANN